MSAYWSFAGGGNDDSGNGRDLTLHGGMIVPSPWGVAYSLDGVDDNAILSYPHGLNGLTAFTVFARLNVPDWSQIEDLRRLFAMGSGTSGTDREWDIHYNTTFGLRLVFSDNGTTSVYSNPSSILPDALPENQWFSLAFTYGGGAVRSFINGHLHREQLTTTGPLFAGNGNFAIGSTGTSGSYFGPAMVSDVAFFPVVLNPGDLGRLHHGLSPLEIA